MEKVINHLIPHVGEQIFGFIDDPGISHCRLVSKTWDKLAGKVIKKRMEKKIIRLWKTLKVDYGQYMTKKKGEYIYAWKICKDWTRLIGYFAIKGSAENKRRLIEFLHKLHLDHWHWLEDPFKTACINGNTELVQLFLDHHAHERFKIELDPEDGDIHCGYNEFMLACGNGKVGKVQELLSKPDIDKVVNKYSCFAQTALLLTCQNGHPDVVKVLLDQASHIVEFDYANSCGRTSFMLACQHGHPKIVELFLDHPKSRIKINAKDKSDMTALMLATGNGHIDVVKAVLDRSERRNIDLNARNEYGFTAFMAACFFGRPEVVKLMLNHDLSKEIDLNAEDNQGNTALLVACKEEYIDILKLLFNCSSSKKLKLPSRRQCQEYSQEVQDLIFGIDQ